MMHQKAHSRQQPRVLSTVAIGLAGVERNWLGPRQLVEFVRILNGSIGLGQSGIIAVTKAMYAFQPIEMPGQAAHDFLGLLPARQVSYDIATLVNLSVTQVTLPYDKRTATLERILMNAPRVSSV
jgi:hypothetical protein